MAKAIINGNEIFGNVHLGEGGDVANPNIADIYDPTQTYNTGDRRIYDDVLYVCNDDNVTGAWDSTKWDSATIDEIISALTADDIPYSQGVSVADKLDELDNKVEVLTVTDKYSSATINAYKSGKVVNIICTVVSIAGGSWVNLGKVAVAPPKQQVSLIALNGSLNVFGQLIINTDGTIQMYHSDSATQAFFNMNISYITD